MSDGAPVIHISPMGNLGNHAMQFMTAMALAARLGKVRYSAVSLPAFGIAHPPVEGEFPATEIVTSSTVPLDRLARALATGALQRVDVRSYAQRMENFLTAAAYRDVFRARAPAQEAVAPDELLCNIRQGDILDGHHPDYVLIPVQFYADLAEETGLTPVFAGQLEDSPYLRALRARFPKSRFLKSRGAPADWERIRSARHIVPAVSTFSWLAAWLSDAERIFMPVLGLFNPAQHRAVDLLPLDDPRYRFYQFPIHYAVPVAGSAEAHAAIHRLWRYMPPDQLRDLLALVPPPRQRGLFLDAFDETFYRATNPDIDAAIACGAVVSGRAHYELIGFEEGRAAFALDRSWYCRQYPMAALEIAQGECWDADQHWLELGRPRCYRRGPADKVAGAIPAEAGAAQ